METKERLETIEETISIVKLLEQQFRNDINKKSLVIIHSMLDDLIVLKTTTEKSRKTKLTFFEKYLGRLLYRLLRIE